jgi:hypothetical protein
MKDFKGILRKVLIGIIVLGIIIALTTGANVWFFWSIFNWLQTFVHAISGLDAPLAKAVAAILMIAVVMLPLGKVVLSFGPLPQKNKGLYRSLVFIVVCLFFTAMYFGSKETYFDPTTGKAMKYYSLSPTGEYKFYSEPGFDPLTGDKLKVATKTIILDSKGLLPGKKAAPVVAPTPVQTYVPAAVSSPVSVLDVTTTKPADIKRHSKKAVKHQRNYETNYDYHPVKQVDPVMPSQVAKPEETVYASQQPIETKSLVHFDNKSSETITITNYSSYVLFKIGPYCSLSKKMEPGTYNAIGDNITKSFTVDSHGLSLIFTYRSAENRQVSAGYNHVRSYKSMGIGPVRKNFNPRN